MSTLTIEAIRKNYGAVETLKGIDIALESGEFLVLLGASGCGKSTLLNIIAGLAEPTSGDIRIDGRSIVGMHPKDRDIAMVFQSYALYPNLTVHRNIGFGLEMRKVARAERDWSSASSPSPPSLVPTSPAIATSPTPRRSTPSSPTSARSGASSTSSSTPSPFPTRRSSTGATSRRPAKTSSAPWTFPFTHSRRSPSAPNR